MSNATVDRTSHINLMENPDVKAFLENCDFMKVPTGKEIDEIVSNFVGLPDNKYNLPKNIISIDGSSYEANVRDELPFTKIGFVKISSLLMYRTQFDRLTNGKFVNPFEVAKIGKEKSALSFTFPSTNIRYNHETSVRAGFRKALDEQLYRCRFIESDPNTSLRTTLFKLCTYDTKSDVHQQKAMKLFKCPSCESEGIELWDVPETQRCPHCNEVLYLSDYLRIWEDVGDSGSNQSALTRFTNVIMHLLVVHYVRYLKEYNKDSYLNLLSDLCFVINGPLAVFGNPARMHSHILKYLYDINQELIKNGRNPIIVIGLQKSGPLCDYLKMVGSSVPNNTIMPVSDEFRYKYVTFDRDPSSSTFGNETYYGQDFLLKTSNAKLYVFDALLPFRDKQTKDVFKIEKSNISKYVNICSYVKLIEEFECDLYTSALIPVVLAQKYTAISLEPGEKVLDLLAKNAIEK